jgi:hypothetical protein
MTAPRLGGTTTALPYGTTAAPYGLGAATAPYGLGAATAPCGPAQAAPRTPWTQAAACASDIIDSSNNATLNVDKTVFILVGL